MPQSILSKPTTSDKQKLTPLQNIEETIRFMEEKLFKGSTLLTKSCVPAMSESLTDSKLQPAPTITIT